MSNPPLFAIFTIAVAPGIYAWMSQQAQLLARLDDDALGDLMGTIERHVMAFVPLQIGQEIVDIIDNSNTTIDVLVRREYDLGTNVIHWKYRLTPREN